MSRDGTLLRRFDDPETSSDPAVVALVRQLRTVDYAPAPRSEFRDELRAQLVAIAPRLVAEGEPTTSASQSSLATSAATARPGSKRLRFARPLRLATACVAVLALGLGGAVWKSQSALPGESLYGLKRASEDVRLSLTTGDTARGHEYLRLSTTRVEEAHDLLGHDSAMASGSGVLASGISPQTAQLVRSTLDAANTDLTTGSSLLGTQAVRTHSPAPLQIMRTWAPGQLKRLSQLSSEVGTGSLRASTEQSTTLVTSALTRARTLGPKVAKGCVATHTDKLGPSCTATTTGPGIVPSTTPSIHPTSGKTPGTGLHTKTGTKTHPGSTGPTTPRSGSSTPPSPGRRHHKHGTASPTPTPILPTLPTLPPILPSGKPTLPITIGSCGISAQIGPIGVALGSCPKGK